jgi:hypothetical protein
VALVPVRLRHVPETRSYLVVSGYLPYAVSNTAFWSAGNPRDPLTHCQYVKSQGSVGQCVAYDMFAADVNSRRVRNSAERP